MTLSLLEMCIRALDETPSFNSPTYIYGNTDDETARTLLAAARKTGEELVRDYEWVELYRTATVTTSNGDALYPTEEDYERLASDSMWDVGQRRPMLGPQTRREWAAITNSGLSSSICYRWRLFGGQIQVDPTPTTAFDFSYEYSSKAYASDMNGDDLPDGWASDSDVPNLPSDVFIHGIRYYFGDSKNLAGTSKWAAEYDAVIQSRQGKNSPSQAVNMAAAVVPPRRGCRRPSYFYDRVEY